MAVSADLTALLIVMLLGTAASPVAMVVTKAKLFRPLRDRIAARSTWLGELFSCPFCMSIWIAGALTAVYMPRPVRSGCVVVDVIVACMLMVVVAALGCGLIFRAYAPMMGASDTEEAP